MHVGKRNPPHDKLYRTIGSEPIVFCNYRVNPLVLIGL